VVRLWIFQSRGRRFETDGGNCPAPSMALGDSGGGVKSVNELGPRAFKMYNMKTYPANDRDTIGFKGGLQQEQPKFI
jgi:hypothetical protein